MNITKETKELIIQFTKSYNLCDQNDYDELNKLGGLSPDLPSYDEIVRICDYYYMNWWGSIHRLDGPAAKCKNTDEVNYYIEGGCLSEEEFNNHPDVKKLKFLKEHPEMKNFL